MSVVTHLSTVQIVFMNRFLVEFLDYLAGMGNMMWCHWHCAMGNIKSSIIIVQVFEQLECWRFQLKFCRTQFFPCGNHQ